VPELWPALVALATAPAVIAADALEKRWRHRHRAARRRMAAAS
jgi:hypothetical protein